jgi:hypothetical protein
MDSWEMGDGMVDGAKHNNKEVHQSTDLGGD